MAASRGRRGSRAPTAPGPAMRARRGPRTRCRPPGGRPARSVASRNAPTDASQNAGPNAAASGAIRAVQAARLVRLADPAREPRREAQRPHVARVVVRDRRPLARDVGVVERRRGCSRASPSGPTCAGYQVSISCTRFGQTCAGECEIARVEHVVVDVLDPVGVVVEERERRTPAYGLAGIEPSACWAAAYQRIMLVRTRRIGGRRDEQREPAHRLVADVGAPVADEAVEQHLRQRRSRTAVPRRRSSTGRARPCRSPS